MALSAVISAVVELVSEAFVAVSGGGGSVPGVTCGLTS
jgi:hypothetical protein